MPTLVYRICAILTQLLTELPLGTNLGLLHVLVALQSGRFISVRSALFPARHSLGLMPEAVRRSSAALREGRWRTTDLLRRWQKLVGHEGRFALCQYEGIRPVACDLTAFFRPRLRGLDSKHYISEAGKALSAVIFGLCVSVGRVGTKCLGLPRLLLRRGSGESEALL